MRALYGTSIGRAGVALATAALVVVALSGGNAQARGKALRLKSVSVRDRSDVALNEVVEFRFNLPLRRNSVDAGSIEIRREDPSGTGFTTAVPGRFKVLGRRVLFTPRLPTHLRDPDDPAGGLFPVGSPQDDAVANGGLRPSTDYQIRILARPRRDAVRGRRGARLRRTKTILFSTRAAEPENLAFTADAYLNQPPPSVRFTNPPNAVPSAEFGYTAFGGAGGVPRNVSMTLFFNRVALRATNLRDPGVVSVELIEQDGDPAATGPVAGAVFVEQKPDDVRIMFQPEAVLPARSVFALRISEDLTDLTGQFAVTGSPDRERLADLYAFLDAARALSPQTPVELLPDPPLHLTTDWPIDDPDARGVLKRNLLELGDTHPCALDARTMLIFTTGE